MGVPLGFSNTYALAMPEAEAKRLSVRTLSDLARHPALKLGLSQEFIARADGWPALKAAYGLAQTPMGLDHGLAYEAIAAGKIDVMDVYSTDAKIERYGLRVLEDDRGVFPRYDAVLLYRLDLPQRLPQAWKALQGLEGRIDAREMIHLNAAAELEHQSFAAVAKSLSRRRKRGRRSLARFAQRIVRTRTSGGLRASTCCWCSHRSPQASSSPCRWASLRRGAMPLPSRSSPSSA